MNDYHVFYGGPFSNWHRCSFFVDFKGETIRFNCAEQCLMYSKAVLFGDEDSADKIINARHPSEQKKFGRQVKNFDQAEWDKHKFDIAYKACFAKFSQNPELRSLILNTKGKLVEASPTDLIWGIGWPEGHQSCKDPNKWRGENLLGKVLDEVKRQIRSEQEVKL
jgi:ribA/ribD-fused uncharacterized protein